MCSKKMLRLLSHKMLNNKQRKPLFKRKRENYFQQLKVEKVKEYLVYEFKNSSTHSLPYIVNDKIHWCERVFWTICFVLSVILIFYLVAAQFARFFETPTVMSVEMDYFNWNISYPAFTLCPRPQFKADPDTLAILVNETATRTGKNLEYYLRSILAANIESLDAFAVQNPNILSLINPKDYSTIASSVYKQIDLSAITTNTNWPISVEDAMTELGMCHVFNSNVAMFENPLKWNNDSLRYEKTNIELSVHDRDFFSQIINYADVYKIYIHSPDETILSTTSSYTHKHRGFLSYGVKVWSTKISEELLETPIRLRKCRFIDEPTSKRYPIYSYNHCMLECRIKMIIRLCGCIPHFYKPLDDERVCNLNELKCVLKYKKEIVTLSISKATLRRFRDKDLPNTSHDCGCLSRCETEVYQKDFENFIPQSNTLNRLRIGISSYPKVRFVKNIIFSFSDAVLKIGGVINLCIGASILSLLEFSVAVLKVPIYLLIHKIQTRSA